MKTAVEWLYTQLQMNNEILEKGTRVHQEMEEKIFEQAKAMEKEQMDKVAGDWWNEGASYMHDGGRKYESFEQYYNETFKSE
jgi:hypothetical protein